MKLINEPLPGLKVLRPFVFEDIRGSFVKPFHEDQLKEHEISMNIKEEFFSSSKKGVLRGMHFQIPPYAHQKLIYCIAGKVLDVFLDLRKSSPTFGQSSSILLSDTNHYLVYLPIGFAHGFLSLEDDSCLVYKTDSVHMIESDQGIRWDSFGFDWGSISQGPYFLSERDRNHPSFNGFISPF